MALVKKTDLVGLDIGSRTIKVAEIADTQKRPVLKKIGFIDIAPGVIEDGAIKDPESVADSIRKLFKNVGIKNPNVAISIGGYSVIVKKINVQTMTEARLPNEANANQMNVLLVAAKKEMINDYINLIQIAGLNPCIIDIDAFALQNIFEVNYGAGEENVALIDIGASKTSLNILKGGSSVFMRDVSLGCGQINQRIAGLAQCSLAEAEAMKFGKMPDKISQDDLKDIIVTVVSDWCSEIRRALDFFYSTYPEDQIKKIFLSGGGANIKEFRQLLAVETSAEVETINPFAKLRAESGKYDASYLQRIAPQAAICMGLAMRRVDDK